MFTPIKPTSSFDDTILNTPQPQATSTVQRKSTLESRFSGNSSNGKRKEDVLREEEPTGKVEDTSLGLLNNMSSVLTNISAPDDGQKLNYFNIDPELEFARKILERCSEKSSSEKDMNKENNANVQNVTNILPISNLALSNEISIPDPNTDRKDMFSSTDKGSTASVTFEPNEITARSSGLSRSTEKQTLLDVSTGSISMSSSTAKLLTQFGNEQYLSDSQVAEKLSLDEASWQQNYTYAMPGTSNEKQRLELSAFSGIIGELDLSVESNAGRKVSVGQYFRRKCADISGLEGKRNINPSINVTLETTTKSNLVSTDSSSLTNVTTLSTASHEVERTQIPSVTTDINESSILSLSTIANTLQDVNSETPRRLVDQLLKAQKKKRNPLIENDARKETYTFPSERRSMLATPNINPIKANRSPSPIGHATKLSLDSRSKSEINDLKEQMSKMLSFVSTKNLREAESSTHVYKKEIAETTSNSSAPSSFKQDAGISNPDIKPFLQNSALSLPSNEKPNFLFGVPPIKDVKHFENAQSNSNLNAQSIKDNESVMSEHVDTRMESIFLQNTYGDIQLYPNNDVVIGKNTEQLCNCIVGITSDVNIEVVNNGDRWIVYSLKLSEVRGDKQNIAFYIPQNVTLIRPNWAQPTRFAVKILKMCKPIIVVLDIFLSDMVAKTRWLMKHIICFKPEKIDLDIICHSPKDELDFECVAENSKKILPITLYNKNSVQLPIKFMILQKEPNIFSIDDTFSEQEKSNKVYNELNNIILKPQEKCVINIKCEGLPNASTGLQKYEHYSKGLLIIEIRCENDTILFGKEVPLYAQIGTCKIQIIDTDIPIIVPKQQGKLVNVINSGNVATHVSASIVPIEGSLNATQNFCVKPSDILLQCGETGSFLIQYISLASDMKSLQEEKHARIKLVAGNNVYYHLVSTEQKSLESENENYMRCGTPNNVASISVPTSPHSIVSSRSDIHCDRNSPSSSTVSSAAVAENVIPIKATHAALMWNSVRSGKCEVKEFTIRNTSTNKIKIQIDIWDDTKSFKFLGDRKMINTSIILAMQRTESKTLAIVFSPYHTGPVTGKITIKHYTPTREGIESQQYKIIPLYGYGGYGKLKISDTFKDANGKMWLSLGTLSSGTTTLRANVKLQNIGDLCTFIKIKIIPKAVFTTMSSSWHVNPREIILNPKEIRQVSIEFHPKREDFAMLQHSEVSHVATISVIYGDEPTRLRIRRLYNKMKESGELIENENEAFRNIVYPICRSFPGEQPIPGLSSARDSIQNFNDLCTGVTQTEIMLTVETCADETLPILHDTDDESQMYYSLMCDTNPADEAAGTSFFVSQTMAEYETPRHEYEDYFIVTPPTVVLNPPVRNEITVTIFSFFKVAQPFQTALSNSDYFSVIPSEGMLPSKRNFPLKIRCSQRIERNMQAVLEIYTENDKQEVTIKVIVKKQ